MTTGRVTQRSTSMTSLAALQASLARLQSTQERVSSGKQLRRASDDPSGAIAAMELRAGKARADQHLRNAEDGLGWLATSDSALQSGLAQVQRARSLVVQGNTATASPSARAALADEVDQIRASLLSVANTTHLGRPVFGGTGSQAYDAATGAYVGDSNPVLRQVGDGTRVSVALPGPQAFGGVFDRLAQISADLRSGTSLTPDLAGLDVDLTTMTSAAAQVGARTNRVEAAQTAATGTGDAARSQLSAIEDVDLPRAIMELQVQQVAYQAALGATAKVLQPSLLDFLR